MDAAIVLAVLAAAMLHASWNLMVKVSADRLVAIGLVTTCQGLIAFSLLAFFPIPLAESWPYLLASVVLHYGYQVFLARAYMYGDLSQVYPLARGSAPLLTYLGTLYFVGEQVSAVAVAGVVILSLGIIGLIFVKGGDALQNRKAIGYALATGLFIAAYTVVDGVGARAAGSAHAYALWMFALDAIPMALTLMVVRRRSYLRTFRENLGTALGGGGMSLGAYWIVIWAMTQAPIAPVAALRETGVLFGALMGTWLLKEKGGRARLAAAAVVVFGVVMVRA